MMGASLTGAKAVKTDMHVGGRRYHSVGDLWVNKDVG